MLDFPTIKQKCLNRKMFPKNPFNSMSFANAQAYSLYDQETIKNELKTDAI